MAERRTLSKLTPKSVKSLLRPVVERIRYASWRLPKKAAVCPVCQHGMASVLKYGAYDHIVTGAARERTEISCGHEKYLCRKCGHVFTTWFPQLDEFSQIYSTHYADDQQLHANTRRSHQEELIRRLIGRRGRDGHFLDFGCGGNFPIAYDLRETGLNVYACDIHTAYPYDDDVLFRFDPERPDAERFDGISSLDAIEHVQELEPTWRYFNHALKEGGFMLHSFPSVFRYGYQHFFSKIPFHACLFSEKSLTLWSEKMGFAYLGPEPLEGSDVPECYWFRKERTI